MKFYKKILVPTVKIITKEITVLEEQKVEVPYTIIRDTYVWETTTGHKSLIKDMTDQHLRNVIGRVQNMTRRHREYKGVSYYMWLDIFEEEMRYRKLYISYNEFKTLYL